MYWTNEFPRRKGIALYTKGKPFLGTSSFQPQIKRKFSKKKQNKKKPEEESFLQWRLFCLSKDSEVLLNF